MQSKARRPGAGNNDEEKVVKIMELCQVCGKEKSTQKLRVEVKLAHGPIIPLVETRNVCIVCKKKLKTTGVSKARNTRLILASSE